MERSWGKNLWEVRKGSKTGQMETALRKLSPDFTGNLKMA